MSVQGRTGYISSFHCSMSPHVHSQNKEGSELAHFSHRMLLLLFPKEKSVKILKEMLPWEAFIGVRHFLLGHLFFSSDQEKILLIISLPISSPLFLPAVIWRLEGQIKNNFTEKTKDYSLIMFPLPTHPSCQSSVLPTFFKILKSRKRRQQRMGNRWGLKSNVLSWSQQGVFSHLVIGNLRSTCLRPVSNSSRWISPFRMEDAPCHWY